MTHAAAHPVRKAAEEAYRLALNTFNVVSLGNNEAAFDAAHEALRAARLAAVKAELEFPTLYEFAKATAVRRLRNRGLDTA